MEITVVGKSPSWTDSDGACSGYLLTEGGCRLLLDCGTGVFGKLRQFAGYDAIDAVVLSHLHSDHFLDLIPFSFALRYSGRRPQSAPRLYGPPGTARLLEGLGKTIGFGDQMLQTFEVVEYDGHESFTVGPFAIRFCEVPHYIQTFAVELVARSGGRFTYGADCAPNEALVEFGSDTDLILVEATEARIPVIEPGDRRGHMTAREAGELARRAGARQALISHYSDELDFDHLVAEARAGFGGPVEIAGEGLKLTL